MTLLGSSLLAVELATNVTKQTAQHVLMPWGSSPSLLGRFCSSMVLQLAWEQQASSGAYSQQRLRETFPEAGGWLSPSSCLLLIQSLEQQYPCLDSKTHLQG